jgi:hypothetical protein
MMKQIKIWSIILTLFLTLDTLYADMKRYEVKSGIIEYTSTGGGDMMGIKTQMSGTNKVAFKEWGTIELHQSVTKSVIMGREENIKDTIKIDNGKVFVVDYEKRVILAYEPSMLMLSEYKDLAKSTQEMIDSMGGKKIGNETIQGYDCEIWEMSQVKLWLYKGIALKSQANVMGITNTMEAISIKLDVPVSDKDLKLPDFPIKSVQESDMPSQMPQMTPEQMQQMQEMMKNFTQK